MNDRDQQLRLLEAVLFASADPLTRQDLARHLPEDADLDGLMVELTARYANRGVVLQQSGDRWAFRTAVDLAPYMQIERQVTRKLSRAALETLAVIAYHQPTTRGEIEEIRGVALSKGTLDTLLEIGWVRPKGRRRTPGRPVTWGTTPSFLDHFGLEGLDALPGVKELKATGMLDSRAAVTAVTARGLVQPDEVLAESEEDETEDEDPWEILAAEFGEEVGPAGSGAKPSEAKPTGGGH